MIKTAVVTPYFNESIAVLSDCHASVVSQIHSCHHILVADGNPLSEIDQWDVDHIKLPQCHNDVGSTPRLIGAYHAIGLGYDLIAFLDADNWYSPDHISQVVKVYESQGPEFISTNRYLCRPDKSIISTCPFTNPQRFIDTSCMIFAKGSFHLLSHWVLMPQYGHPISDRIILYHILRARVKSVHIDKHTVYYRCYKEGIYHHLGEDVPVGVVKPPNYKMLFEKWIQDGNDPLV